MDPIFEHQLLQTRRQFFGSTGLRLGGLPGAEHFDELRGARIGRIGEQFGHHPLIPWSDWCLALCEPLLPGLSEVACRIRLSRRHAVAELGVANRECQARLPLGNGANGAQFSSPRPVDSAVDDSWKTLIEPRRRGA